MLSNIAIERITGVQIDNGIRKYLVHFQASTPFWVSERNLIGHDEPVQNFLTELFSSFILENTEIKRSKRKRQEDHQNQEQTSSSDISPLNGYQEVHSFNDAPQSLVSSGLEKIHIKQEPSEFDKEPQTSMARSLPREETDNSFLPTHPGPSNGSTSPPANLNYFINNIRPDIASIDPSETAAGIDFPNFQNHKNARNGHQPPNLASMLGQTPKTTSNVPSISGHPQSDLQERPKKQYICWVCSQKFPTNSGLMRHVRIHTGYKPFQCDYCERTFSRKDHKISHERTHTGEKPYVCNTCGQVFKQKSELNRHRETIHLAEIPMPNDDGMSKVSRNLPQVKLEAEQ